RPHHWKRRPPMDYFAGLDVSMAETHICVMARTGAVVHRARVPSTPADIAAELAQVPTCQPILFQPGRMPPMLFPGLSQLGLPVVCGETRQAYQALKSLATHKTDRNDARPGASGANRVLQARLCEVPACTRHPVPGHRSQEAGRAAGYSREP